MCVGIVALGVTLSRGQEVDAKSESTEAPVVVQPEAADVNVDVDVDGDIAIGDLGTDEDIVISNEDGKVIEGRRAAELGRARVAKLRVAMPQAFEKTTREAVEKLIDGLTGEAKRLAEQGNKEQAEQKVRSAEALKQVLAQSLNARWFRAAGPQARFIQGRVTAVAEIGPEMKKQHGRVKELAEQLAKLHQEGRHEEAAKLEKELAETVQKMADAHFRGVFVYPANPQGTWNVHGPGNIAHHPMPPMAWHFAGSPEADELMHKADALSQAAAKLKEAGMAEQAGDIAKQAEATRAKAEELRGKAARAEGVAHAFHFGPPAGELVRSIHELQEQIQILRKEVAELRELLQKK